MCMYLNEIVSVVDEYVQAGNMFTAYDVTMEVRKRTKDRVQHYEVKNEVHKMFRQGDMVGYNRDLANLPNVNPQPWVYYPPSADPSTYAGQPTSAPVAAIATPTASMTSLDDGDVGGDGSVVYKFDSTDCLCVPNKLVRELGFKAGDEVDVVCAPPLDELFVVAKGETFPGVPPHVSSQLATYTVDSYDNVRISRDTFTKVGINGMAFEIERDGKSGIKVKKFA